MNTPVLVLDPPSTDVSELTSCSSHSSEHAFTPLSCTNVEASSKAHRLNYTTPGLACTAALEGSYLFHPLIHLLQASRKNHPLRLTIRTGPAHRLQAELSQWALARRGVAGDALETRRSTQSERSASEDNDAWEYLD